MEYLPEDWTYGIIGLTLGDTGAVATKQSLVTLPVYVEPMILFTGHNCRTLGPYITAMPPIGLLK